MGEENKIKRYIIAFLITILSILSIPCSALAVGKIDIFVDDNLKQGKIFNTYVTVTSDEQIGAISIGFEYDGELLTLSSVSLEEKLDSDYLQYNDSNGQIKVIFMTKTPQKEKTFKLRFKTANDTDVEYAFYSYVFEAYSSTESKIEGISPDSVKIKITQASENEQNIIEISDSPASDTSESSSDSSRKIPSKSEASNRDKQNSAAENSRPDGQTTSNQPTSGNEYYINTQNDPLSDSTPDYPALIAATVAVSVGVVVCVKQYRKLKK